MNHLPLVILVDAEEVVVNNAKVPWHDGWAKRNKKARQLLRALQLPHRRQFAATTHFSSSSSTATPRTKVVLRGRQFSASSSTDCSAYYSCTTSPVLSFQLPSYSAYYSCTTKSPVLISQLPRYSTPSSCTTLCVLKLYY